MVQPRDKALILRNSLSSERALHFMRKLLSGLVLVLGLAVAPAAAHADSFTYSLLLTPTNPASNVPAGSGSFTINAAPAASGNSIFTVGNGLTDMSFSIGGDTFCLVSSASCVGAAFGAGSEAFFQNGTLTSVIYNGGDIDKTFDFSLNSGAL